MNHKPIVCFGETLWDVLPTGKQAGGAPMNVALHLRHLGLDARLISRIGSDDLGRELLDFLHEKGLPADYVQVGQSHLTGVAKANVSDANEVTYKLVQPVAWDYIMPGKELMELVEQSACFVYGSLVARSPQSYETLKALIEVAPRRVFDVNLRAPHYTRQTVEELLSQAHIAKLNEHELAEITGWYGAHADLQTAMTGLRDRYALQTLCVTLGAEGAALLDETGFYRQAGFLVEVVDTIGSGDAFLAAFLYNTLLGVPRQQTLAYACATGAYVATQRGATPVINDRIINNHLNALPTAVNQITV